jgi:hypothetical protein
VELLDHGGLYEIGCACGREEFSNFAKREIDDVGAGFVDQSFRGADDQFDVASVRRRLFDCARVLSPLWGFLLFVVGPTACAVGCILSPLRGSSAPLLGGAALQALRISTHSIQRLQPPRYLRG